jgi:hypothetical protein
MTLYVELQMVLPVNNLAQPDFRQSVFSGIFAQDYDFAGRNSIAPCSIMAQQFSYFLFDSSWARSMSTFFLETPLHP